MSMLDLQPAARQLADVVAGIDDQALDGPTPCEDMAVGDLLDHVHQLAGAFTRAARKEAGHEAGPPPRPDAANLGPNWRTDIDNALGELAMAWRDPDAWQGTTRAGGLEMPGAQAGVVAADEVVLHGWDLAVATDQPFAVEPDLLAAAHGFVSSFSGPGMEDARAGLFGPVVEVDASAPLLDRVLGLAGRDPSWSPTA